MNTLKFSHVLVVLLAVSLFSACEKSQDSITPAKIKEVTLSGKEAQQIAKEAFIYGFPMVVNFKTLAAYVLDRNSPEYKGDLNELVCEARLYTPDDKAIVTPNSDTPYCMGWLDIRKEPIVLSLPEMEPERFYHFQFIDLYTHNYAYLGTLTTGNKAGKYLLVNHAWKGEKPDGIDDLIRSETDLFFVVVRTQLMHENDLENVKRIQGEYQMQTISAYIGKDAPEAVLANDFPEWNEGDQFTSASFKYLDAMLRLVEPVSGEKPLMERFARLGIGTDQGFDIHRFDEETQKAIEQGVKDGFEAMESFMKEEDEGDPLASAKIFGTREFLKKSAWENYQLEDFYILRAVAAYIGLYGNSGTEAIYPAYLTDSEGNPSNTAENNYTITFQKGDLPPVKAFWSLSIYDAQTQLFIHNPLNRYLLNSIMKDDFVYGENGSLTLYIQKDSPGKALQANWLPAPDGPMYMVMRLYGPEEAVLKGEWVNPPLVKVSNNR